MRLFCLLTFLLTIGTAYSQNNCGKYPKEYIPKNLTDALSYMDCVWTDKEKEEFKNKTESDAVADAHFAAGQGIRNGWDLWKGKNSLYRQFSSRGIKHPEDISSIILTSFYRRLNNKDIDFEAQVNEFDEYKKKNEIWTKERIKKFKTLNTGDTVKISFSKSRATRETFSLAYLGQRNTSLDSEKHCFVTGRIADKRKKKESCLLTIEVINLVNCDNSKLGDRQMVKGTKFEYNMTVFNIRFE